jgi:fructokinase
MVFGVILGTGVGGGVVVRRHVLTGANAIAGEWGHNPLPRAAGDDLPLPACYCGRSGCIEAYLSGPALARDHQRRTGETLDPPKSPPRERWRPRLRSHAAAVTKTGWPGRWPASSTSSTRRSSSSAAACPISTGCIAMCRNVAVHMFFRTFSTPNSCRRRHGDSSGVRGAAWLWD